MPCGNLQFWIYSYSYFTRVRAIQEINASNRDNFNVDMNRLNGTELLWLLAISQLKLYSLKVSTSQAWTAGG